MKMSIVYQATNLVNGKRYIGVTKLSLRRRRAEHNSDAAAGKKTRFWAAIRKYGKAAFSWEVLQTYETEQDAVVGEVAWVAKLKPEYNMTAGGKGIPGLRHTKETRQRLRELALAQVDTWSTRRQAGPESSARAVRCLDDGAVYPSASAAARVYGVAKSSIIEVCNGRNPRRRTAGGRHFAYLEVKPEEVARQAMKEVAKRRAKLDQAAVDQLRSLFPTMMLKDIAIKFGAHPATISDIKRGLTWKDQPSVRTS